GVTIRAVERSVFAAGLPADAEAALLIELDGIEAGLDEEAARAESICRANRARHVRLAGNERERGRFWAARKGAFGAMGRLAPDLMLQDAVVPRSRLPEVLAGIYRIGTKYELLVANVFHAGDGNLHPYICFDSRRPEEVRRVKEAGREMMATCVRAGGTITGEHGVGLDKSEYLPLIFSPDDMDAMLRVRAAFDPDGLCNPGKIIPTSRSCGEARTALRRGHVPVEAARVEAQEEAERVDMQETGREDVLEAAPADTHQAARVDTHEVGRVEIDEARRVDADAEQSVNASTSHAALPPTALPNTALPHAASSSEFQSPALLLRRSFNIEKAHEALARIVGAEHVKAGTSAAGTSASSLDTSLLSASPSIAVAPATAEEACEVVRLAALEGWAIIPAGAGTWLDAGQPLRRADVILQTSRMGRIIEHEPADLVASAEAGVGLSRFNAELRRAGQCLPLDPPGYMDASLGGIAATGMTGAQSFGYGAPRSFVIGMRVALADARIRKAGGRVVKNVAGYDLCKLFVGSYGTLGVILDLTFKLRPRPAQESTVVAAGSLAALWLGARELLKARLFPVAVELLSARAAAACGVPLTDENEYALLVRFAGASATVAFQLEQARARLDQQQDIQRTSVSLDDELLWQRLATLSRQQDDSLIWRAHVPARELGAILTNASLADFLLFPPGSCWHAGAGDGRLRVISPVEREAQADVRLLERWRERVSTAGGCLIVESAPREYKEAFKVWGDVGRAATLMRRIKQQLDEADTFSPGRFDTFIPLETEGVRA
ncbi:MAG TPA: FAD-linked oxidase C-terminal domain-containing protein, partial [Pyrinomonadaceae bacterium]